MKLFNTLYEVYNRVLENIQRKKARRVLQRSALQHRVRPLLEILEDRLVPAGPAFDNWVGSVSSDWNTAGNWQSENAQHQVIQSAVPDVNTDVTIDPLLAGNVAPVIGVGNPLAATCASITDQSGTTSLTINTNSSLDITGQSNTVSHWGSANKAPSLIVNGIFQVDNSSVNTLVWENGNITGSGSICIANGATMEALLSATNLGVSLFIGKDGINNTNQTATSTFEVSQANAGGFAMTGNLSIGQSISVQPKGNLLFESDTNQNTAGGIVLAAGNTIGQITDSGSVTGTADTGGQALTVQPQVIIAVAGTWTEVKNEKMKFTFTDANTDPSVSVSSGGTLTLQDQSNIAVTDPIQLNVTGTLIVPGVAGSTASATVQGTINDSGNLQIGDATGFSTLTATNVDIENGTLTMAVKFDTNGNLTAQDTLNVSGKLSIAANLKSGATLALTTTGTPAAGANVQLATAGQTATRSGALFVFSTTTWTGYGRWTKGTLAGGYTLTN